MDINHRTNGANDMRTTLVEAKTAAAARKAAPWAAKVVKVTGGYMAFESLADYETWRRQR